MKQVKFAALVRGISCLMVITGCSSGGGDIVIDTGDGNPDEVITGTGDDPGKTGASCYPAFQDNELNVVTWNIEFLSSENTDLLKVKAIIENLDADIIAVQEISEIADFNALANSLQEWQGFSLGVDGFLDLGYLVKTDAFLEIGNPFVAVNTSPRETIGLTVTHASGVEVTFLNVHLKAKGSQSDINSRTIASNSIKTYIDNNLATEAVIVLGDFNDDINDGPFDNFINDPLDYRFADQDVTVPSYPSWPSDLDHILVTNELFDLITDARTLTVNSCVSNYYTDVSDHRPVLASFK